MGIVGEGLRRAPGRPRGHGGPQLSPAGRCRRHPRCSSPPGTPSSCRAGSPRAGRPRHAGASGVGTAAIRSLGPSARRSRSRNRSSIAAGSSGRPRRRLHGRRLRARREGAHRRARGRCRARREAATTSPAIDALAVGGTIVRSASWPTPATFRSVRSSRSGPGSSAPCCETPAREDRGQPTLTCEVRPHFDRGRLRPVVDSRFPLDRIGQAHEHMEANANVGKILVDL